MGASQLGVASLGEGTNIISFAPRAGGSARLTLSDRMEAMMWLEQARGYGYDRLVVHERSPDDPPEVESFLSIYRRGEAWASWGVARSGGSILAWSSVSGADVGRFASVADALAALLSCGGPRAPGRPGAQVIHAFG
ncbi:MAG: hypothetical protein WDN04_15985 [Rhodospirillales bacterium]